MYLTDHDLTDAQAHIEAIMRRIAGRPMTEDEARNFRRHIVDAYRKKGPL